MSSFSDFKNKAKSSISDLSKALESIEGKKDYKDDRFWRATPDKSGNGYAVIRFLPAPKQEELPFIKLYSHAFQGKNGWFIENCLTTSGAKCPVCELNNELWNSGIESDKNIARERKRKLSYISNILVIKDESNPQNEGKVFLFKYGIKIFDKIKEAMYPEFKDESAMDPFNFWAGADFKLKIRKVAGYTNYDKSEFSPASPLLGGDDAKLEAIWNKQYPLNEFVSPKNFKDYATLKTRLYEILGDDVRSGVMDNQSRAEDETIENPFNDSKDEKAAKSRGKTSASGKKQEPSPTDEPGEEMDSLSYFQKLAGD